MIFIVGHELSQGFCPIKTTTFQLLDQTFGLDIRDTTVAYRIWEICPCRLLPLSYFSPAPLLLFSTVSKKAGNKIKFEAIPMSRVIETKIPRATVP